MANLLSIARPYAKAAFDFAKEQKDIPSWKIFLQNAALIAEDKIAKRVLESQVIQAETLFHFLQDVLKPLDAAKTNFLKLLTQNKRAVTLQEIFSEFCALETLFEQKMVVRVVTAHPIDETLKNDLTKRLSERFEKTITLTCEENPEILGGAIFYIKDTVIDDSLRGKLNRLLKFMLR